MAITKIEWADETWNPIVGIHGGWGCNKVSPGCDNCYAEVLHRRFGGRGDYEHSNHLFRLKENILMQPFKRRKPTTYFVCSTMDLFHHNVTDEQFNTVIHVMVRATKHKFLLLSKRPEMFARRFQVWQRFMPFNNIWLGVSAENQFWFNKRVPQLLQMPSNVHFVSCEPLIESIDLRKYVHFPTDRRKYPNWIIVGGESGKKARPMHPDWVRRLRGQCKEGDIAFFFKQWGSWQPTTMNAQIVWIPEFNRKYHCLALPNGKITVDEWHDPSGKQEATILEKRSKDSGGGILDGATHLEIPFKGLHYVAGSDAC